MKYRRPFLRPLATSNAICATGSGADSVTSCEDGGTPTGLRCSVGSGATGGAAACKDGNNALGTDGGQGCNTGNAAATIGDPG